MAFTDHPQPEMQLVTVGVHTFIGESHSQQLLPHVVRQVQNEVAKKDVVVLEGLSNNNRYGYTGNLSAMQIAESQAVLEGKEVVDLHGEMSQRYPTLTDLWKAVGVADSPARVQAFMVMDTVQECVFARSSKQIDDRQVSQYIQALVLNVSGVGTKLENGTATGSDKMLVQSVISFSTKIIKKCLADPYYMLEQFPFIKEYADLNSEVRDIFYSAYAHELTLQHPDQKFLFVMGEHHQKAIENTLTGANSDQSNLVERGRDYLDRALKYIQQI